ncbi:Glycosyltransferase involved in cell wall bisynthesis [Pseudomonas benzenivorans]|nr:glycosyltransferase [Pseudomonas benzenivorans]SDG69429.1 Glycosyltransferase involved in cell wall bisynthesis [Pseudomonas benzenivorans]
MRVRRPFKALFYCNVLIVCLLLGYKAYLNFVLSDFEAEHTTQIETIQAKLERRESFSFAVVGNINNSVGIFERRIIPMLNASGVDFMISAGNAVSGGGEDKYRALHGSLSHLQMPYLLTFGAHEYEEFGSYRFYEHFGPHFFSFHAGNSRFVFLDGTGKTPWRWQILWLKDLLRQGEARHTFLFTGKPLLQDEPSARLAEEPDYLQPLAFREALLALIDEYAIDAVFAANVPLFAEQQRGRTRFITTGGAGGLVLNDAASFHHYVKVSVSAQGIGTQLQRLEAGQHPLFKRLESLWFFIYSLFYVGYLNFILLVSGLAIAAIKLYALAFAERDYYPNFDLDPSPWTERPLRVAMFTNNYLPFIGGVPISIERLRRGLEAMGNAVLIVAPGYREQAREAGRVVRVPSILAMGENREFRLANIFLRRIGTAVRDFRPDLIHLHHPFWLGSLGLFLAHRLRVPAVFTYHTRLEHYAHFVPLPGTLFRNLISHALIKRFANKCDAVIVPTYSAEEYLRMIGVKTPIFVQSTGIEYQRFQAVTAEQVATLRTSLGIGEEKVLISVSRLSNEKNIDFLIDAIASLRQRTERPFRFLMIGDGHQRERLQKRIDELNLGAHFRLLGGVPPEEMAVYYRLGDLFLFASKSETQGMVILEAMAAGLPVVAVRSSGIDDVVRQGYNGFKTPEKLALWCERVALLLEDDELRGEMSSHALIVAREHSIEQFAEGIKEIYATVIAASRAP